MNGFRRSDITPSAMQITAPAQKYDGTQGPACIELARQGMWPEQWCAELGFTLNTLYAWANTHPEFEECVIEAWHLLHGYWSAKLHSDIHKPGAHLMFKVMARRFPSTWGGEFGRNTLENFIGRNRQIDAAPMAGEVEEATPIRALTDDDLDRQIAALTARLGDVDPG
jgi:hypothetical protein